jgi:hypothetical protein
MRHVFASTEDAATFVSAVLILGGFGVLLLRRLGQIIEYLRKIAELPEVVAAHGVQLADHEVRLQAVETVHRTIETTTYTRAVDPGPPPMP